MVNSADPPPDVNNLIRDFILTRIKSAFYSYVTSSQLSHSGFKGEIREIFLRDIVAPLLSPDIACGSGIVIDRFGSQAAQSDVVIYARDVIPSINFVEGAGIYPVESCFYAVEVKSCITSDQIKLARDGAVKLRSLNNLHHPLASGSGQQKYGPASTMPRSVLFGFSSDLKSDVEHEFRRFRKIVDEAPSHDLRGPPIRAFCVMNRGYWYYGAQIIDGIQREGWYFVESDGNYSEVASLIGGMFNTIANNKFERYGLPFGLYLIKNQPVHPVD